MRVLVFIVSRFVFLGLLAVLIYGSHLAGGALAPHISMWIPTEYFFAIEFGFLLVATKPPVGVDENYWEHAVRYSNEAALGGVYVAVIFALLPFSSLLPLGEAALNVLAAVPAAAIFGWLGVFLRYFLEKIDYIIQLEPPEGVSHP